MRNSDFKKGLRIIARSRKQNKTKVYGLRILTWSSKLACWMIIDHHTCDKNDRWEHHIWYHWVPSFFENIACVGSFRFNDDVITWWSAYDNIMIIIWQYYDYEREDSATQPVMDAGCRVLQCCCRWYKFIVSCWMFQSIKQLTYGRNFVNRGSSV